jgi:hypothetical protein
MSDLLKLIWYAVRGLFRSRAATHAVNRLVVAEKGET